MGPQRAGKAFRLAERYFRSDLHAPAGTTKHEKNGLALSYQPWVMSHFRIHSTPFTAALTSFIYESRTIVY
jgi:hypothetical protein